MAKRTETMRKIIDRIALKIRGGYDTPTEFHRQTGIPVAAYTVLRALDNSMDAPAVPTLIVLASYAGFRNHEIADMLTEIGDTFWPRVLGRSHVVPTIRDQALLDAVHRVVEAEPSTWPGIVAHVQLLASAHRVDLSDLPPKLGAAA